MISQNPLRGILLLILFVPSCFSVWFPCCFNFNQVQLLSCLFTFNCVTPLLCYRYEAIMKCHFLEKRILHWGKMLYAEQNYHLCNIWSLNLTSIPSICHFVRNSTFLWLTFSCNENSTSLRIKKVTLWKTTNAIYLIRFFYCFIEEHLTISFHLFVSPQCTCLTVKNY